MVITTKVSHSWYMPIASRLWLVSFPPGLLVLTLKVSGDIRRLWHVMS